MKIDWFRLLIIICVVVLLVNVYFLQSAHTDFPRAEIDLSPYAGLSQFRATIFTLLGDSYAETPVMITAGKQDHFRAIMDEYLQQPNGKVESLSVIDVYENNGRIYLDLGRNSFSHPGVAPANIGRHVQAIVNSLTSINRRLPVQFLFEGSILTEPILGQSFRQSFHRNEMVLDYHRGDIRAMMNDFLEQVEAEQYALVRQLINLPTNSPLTDTDVIQAIRTYRQTKKDTTARQIDVYSEGDGYLVQIYFNNDGGQEQWQVQVIDNLHYIQFEDSPLDR